MTKTTPWWRRLLERAIALTEEHELARMAMLEQCAAALQRK